MPGRSEIAPRVAGVVLALVTGVLVGTLGSFKYRYGLTGAVPLPIGLVLVLVMIALVLAAIRIATRRRLYGIATAVGILAAVALFTMKGPGGSVVVPQGDYSTVWTVAPALIAAVVLGAPGRRRRSAQRADGILDAPPEGTPPQ